MPDLIVDALAAPFDLGETRHRGSVSALAHLSLRLKLYRWLLRTVFPDPQGRLLDLGSGPGHFARIASRHGFAVTALDARPPWTLAEAASSAGAPNDAAPARREFDFVRGDLREVEDMSGFEAVACIGVLYHLPLADQRRLLARSAGRPLIIDTELYDGAEIPPGRAHRFTPATAPEGYSGALCRERDEVYSSHGDAESFWFDETSILRAFADAGRRRVTVVDPSYRSAFGPRRWYVLHD